MASWWRRVVRCLAVVAVLGFGTSASAQGNLPNPTLNLVTPAGAQVGTSVEITVAGDSLDALTTLTCTQPRVVFKRVNEKQFLATIPADAEPGSYEIRAVGRHGISSSRSFLIGRYTEIRDASNNDSADKAQVLNSDVTVNGAIETGGDQDFYQFTASRDERVVIECWAERIDSPLRAVLEVYDESGKRLAVNRGFFGIDPLIAFSPPADGRYFVRLHDLVFAGSAEHVYRLDIGTGPRVVFSVPPVVQRGKTSRVTLFGWNLNGPRDTEPVAAVNASVVATETPKSETQTADKQRPPLEQFDRVEVDLDAPHNPSLLSLRLRPAQATIDGFAYLHPGSQVPLLIGIAEAPVQIEEADNHTPTTAQPITVPTTIGGQLIAGNERDWFAVDVRRGEVLWIDAWGERLGSPVDLDVSLFDGTGTNELARFEDQVHNIDGKQFPTAHLDPAGRWVAPEDGRFLIVVRNLIGGLDEDPRRIYALNVRREVVDFDVVVVPRPESPSSLNVSRNGRVLADLLAFRRQGMTGAIRVFARNLPAGITCPDVWLGPGIDRAPLVLSAHRDTETSLASLELIAEAKDAGERRVQAGTMVRGGTPNGWGRLSADLPLAVAGHAPLRITANGHELRTHHLYGDLKVRHSPGGVLDVAVNVERDAPSHQAEVKLIGVGLPAGIQNQIATIPSGKNKGYLSFYLPPGLALGKYTLAVQAETTIPHPEKSGQSQSITVVSDPVTFEVHKPGFIVQTDPYAPKQIRRGETVKLNYTAKRINGFIGKIHTEIFAAGPVIGIRGRGVTFVSQTNSGTIQIVANDDAPLGKQPFLRLYGVGVVEDEVVYHGSKFFELEIVE